MPMGGQRFLHPFELEGQRGLSYHGPYLVGERDSGRSPPFIRSQRGPQGFFLHSYLCFGVSGATQQGRRYHLVRTIVGLSDVLDESGLPFYDEREVAVDRCGPTTGGSSAGACCSAPMLD